MSDETIEATEATMPQATEAAAPEAAPEAPEAADLVTETTGSATPEATPAEAQPATDTKVEELPDLTPEELIAAMESTFKDFTDGDIVDGEVVKIDRDEVLLDIGYKSEGVIPSKELSIRHDVDPNEVVKVGDRIEALVLQKEDKEGRLILSKKRAQYERAWGRIEQVMNSGETIKGPVIEVVKGGLILDIGLRGFLPASLVDLRRVRDLHPFVGQELEAKIIELDRNRNNVVLSRRAFLEESQSEGRKKFLESLQKNERRKGTVSSIVNFGAFVDLGGVDGLVHVSELSWKHVDHPSEVVAVGQEVDVEVLDVDLERERVSLSLKATQEDPWKEFERTSQAGSIISGQVTKLVPFGAFVRVGPGIEGLVHISELSHEHVDTPESVLSVGDEVQVKVIDVDVNRRRVSLSIRQVTEPPRRAREPEVEREERRPAAQPEMKAATLSIPQEILDAVAQAEAAEAVAPAPTPTAPAETADEAAPASEPAVAETETFEAPSAAEVAEVADEVAAEAVAEAVVEVAADEELADAVAAEAVVEIAEAETPQEAEAIAEAAGLAEEAIAADEAEVVLEAEQAVEVAEMAEEVAEEAATEVAADEEVSLEAILEDLKRREGRTE